LASQKVFSREVLIDSKGRISIPSDLRRSLGFEEGDSLSVRIDLDKGLLVIGRSGVEVSTAGCGPASPGSKDLGKPLACRSGFPGCGPEEREVGP